MRPRTAIVTGASRGIGLATALRLAREGCNLVICARNPADLQRALDRVTATGAACEAVPVDVGTGSGAAELIEIAVRRFGRIEILVNNAGFAPLAPVEKLSDADFDACIAVNIAATFRMTRGVWPILRDGGGGTIVNVSSIASIDPFPGFSVYGANKAWVNLFTKATADEGRACGIRVFAVAPGAVETRMLRSAFPDLPADQALEPEAVAEVIATLCRDELGPASGQTLFVRK